jgi:hypothetical protein
MNAEQYGKELGDDTDTLSYLRRRTDETRRRGRRTLLVGGVLMGCLYVLLAASARWVSERVSNPGLLINAFDEDLRERLPELKKSLEKEITASAGKGIERAPRALLDSLPVVRQAFETDFDDFTERVAGELEQKLNGRIEEVLEEENDRLKSILKSRAQQGADDALRALLEDRLKPSVEKMIEREGYDDLSILIAVDERLKTLETDDATAPEELAEIRLLNAALDALISKK